MEHIQHPLKCKEYEIYKYGREILPVPMEETISFPKPKSDVDWTPSPSVTYAPVFGKFSTRRPLPSESQPPASVASIDLSATPTSLANEGCIANAFPQRGLI